MGTIADPSIRGRDHNWQVGDVVRLRSHPFNMPRGSNFVKEGDLGIITGFPNDFDTQVVFPMDGQFIIWSARLEVVGHIEEEDGGDC